MPMLVAAALTILLDNASAHTASLQTFAAQRDVLKAEIAIATLPPGEIQKLPLTQPIEHDTEVSRSEAVTVIVSIHACEKDARGACNASTDVVAYKPDGSVHSEMKGLSLNTGRTTAPLTLLPQDVTGLYRVVATVRDLNARRFAKVERIFGVK